MSSLRYSLSEFLHCILQILCCTVLVLGEVDKAFIDVVVEDEGQNSTFANIVGKFARIGAIKQVDGELKELDSCDQPEDKDQEPDDTGPGEDTPTGWIGVVHISALEHGNTCGSESCSILDRIKKAMVLGASAIIIITINQRVIRRLDLAQMFSRPIVIINGTISCSKLMDALGSGRNKLMGRVSYNSSLVEIKLLSTLTLWATCGRPSGWEGVVCLGNPERSSSEEVNSQFIGSSSFFASVLFCILVFKTQLSQWFHNYWISKKEELLRQETVEAIAKLKVRKYKQTSSMEGKFAGLCTREQEKKDSEMCAVCLDEFLHCQFVRTLPCGHEFHRECVDRWLLAKRTCPLCKGNIIEWLSRLNTMNSSCSRQMLVNSDLNLPEKDELLAIQQRTTVLSRARTSPSLVCETAPNVSSGTSRCAHTTCTISSVHRGVSGLRCADRTQHR